MLASLVGVFLAQTWLVYSDPAGRKLTLSPAATVGSGLWHRHNCQSCHQIFGFGGFLGPDLTNVATRLAGAEGSVEQLAERLATMLVSGSGRMPAFRLGADERLALATFFQELSGAGVGQVVVRATRAPRTLLDDALRSIESSAGTLTAPEADGLALMRKHGCIDCHLPNARSVFRSTDLTRINGTVEATRVATILTDGIPEKGMPRLALSPGEIEGVAASLALLERHGSEVRLVFETAEKSSSGSLADLPWFEYP